MARGRVTSFDQDLFQEPEVPVLDGLLSSSWPAAVVPNRHCPEPPRAPSRKPSDADWEVPPLHLPTGPRKRSCSTDCASSSTTREDVDASPLLPAAAEDDDDDEEQCVFAFDRGNAAAFEDDDDGQFQLKLVGLDEDAAQECEVADMVFPTLATGARSPEVGSPQFSSMTGDPRNRSQSVCGSPQLGASPTLLSALERVAAEAGAHLGAGRYRIGTM
eukprot:CAMPEP_0204521000 /NCGR_PEP_ID=MMETSP0661-20131031/5556_1 /ASSEMBLY_ACC=CAM_ASM_000606 /TAXON_ID=109239 /ORGANISM="Alexandrium margalefi, Strain AMGDE01CS-322" /LENGTH=216 /DNA_ID=CAMNT_0051526575 /DNA_START=31 /DNA_END=681 /DNA_ORIENTATION=+